MVVNGIDVTVNGLNDVSEQEIVNYIDYVQAQTKEKVNSLKLSATKDGVSSASLMPMMRLSA